MGKEKQHRGDAPVGAFTRMNYLCQAAHLMARTTINNPLCNYYNKLMKEISKKVVEKLHPDLKRTMCSACNFSLTGESYKTKVKLKSSKRKKKKQKAVSIEKQDNCNLKKYKTSEKSVSYKKCPKEIKNKKPNKINIECCRCGFSKSYLQQPSYQLWIHRAQNSS